MRSCIILLTIYCLLAGCQRTLPATGGGNTAIPGFPFKKRGIMDFSKIEKHDDQLKEQFIKANPAFFKDEFDYYSTAYENVDSLKLKLHPYDINSDGRTDLIYDGGTGGEPQEVELILNTPRGFKLVFRDEQYLLKFITENNRIVKLYTMDPGCCASYINFNKIFTATYAGNIPTFTLGYFTAYHCLTKIPEKYFKKAVPFMALNDGYKMRINPEINNSQVFPDDSLRGNTMCDLAKGTKGIALAQSVDKTGRVWWFVQLDPGTQVSDTEFYDEEDIKAKPAKMGWISSRFVKRLDN